MKLSTIVIGLGLGLVAPIIAPDASDSVVMAQNYNVNAKDFSSGVQAYLNGMGTLSHSETFLDNGDLGLSSYSRGYFQGSSDMFFRVTMNDPNYKSGRAMEMYLLSKVALNQDITQDVKELMSDGDFKYKTKLKNFFIDILNGKKIDINFLNEKNNNIQNAIRFGRKYERHFAWIRRGEIMQTLYEVDERKLDDLDEFGTSEVVDISRRYINEKDKDAAIGILVKFTNKWQDEYILPYRVAGELAEIGDIPNAIRYLKIAKARVPPSKEKKVQEFLDYLKK